MDLQLPDIYCKEVKIIECYVESIVENVEQWFSKYLKTKWTDDHDMVKSMLIMFPQCEDVNKLIIIIKSVIWFVKLDDYLDENPDQMEHWLKVIERKKAITNDSLEIMFEIIINELMAKPFAYSQKIRIMDAMTMFVESYKTSTRIRNGSLKATIDEFNGCRYADGFMHFLYVMVEFDLGINLSDKWHIEVFREFHIKISDHVVVINDIYSYKKEMKSKGYPEYTYMSIVRKHSNITFEKALQEAVKRVEILDIEISNIITKLKSLADEIPVEYINRVIDIKDGNHYWSKTCKRYNNV